MRDTAGTHLSDDEILEMVRAGELAPRARVHVERCSRCRREHTALERLIEDARRNELEQPPPEVVERSVGLFGRQPVDRAPTVETAAVLVPEGAIAAVRNTRRGHGEDRQTFVADGAGSVVVQRRRHGGDCQVVGQVHGLLPLGAAVFAWLERDGRILCEAPVDEHGLFMLDAEGDQGDLVVELEHGRIRVPLAEANGATT